MVVININKNNKKSPTNEGNINNKINVPVIEEVFKSEDINDRRITLETMLLSIIRKSEFNGKKDPFDLSI